MPNVQSKLTTTWKMIPSKYINQFSLEFQRAFLVVLSLLKTHRRKAILLSLGPATILKFITVLLPIIKLLPPTIKAIRTLGYFTKSSNNRDRSNGRDNSNNNSRSTTANRDSNAPGGGQASDGLGMMSMDELGEILWTPAEDSYWERVHAMVSRFGLCKTLGISLAGVRPGRVEVVMPFRAEVSGEGGSFHASLLPTLIALTSQLTGMTLLPRHFTLKPIDFKCNILSDCDPSTYLLVSRGAVVVRGDHSITVKVEILKANNIIPGSTEAVTSPSSSIASASSLLSWRSWTTSAVSSLAPVTSSSVDGAAAVLVPGTGIERKKFSVCASGMQTSVVVRADTDPDNEEENEMMRLRKVKEQQRSLRRSTSSSSSWSSSSLPLSAAFDITDESIFLGDSFQPRKQHTIRPELSSSEVTLIEESNQPQASSQASSQASLYDHSPSSLLPSTEKTTAATTAATSTLKAPLSYASAVRYGVEHEPHHDHYYEETSDTEAWQSSLIS